MTLDTCYGIQLFGRAWSTLSLGPGPGDVMILITRSQLSNKLASYSRTFPSFSVMAS